MRAIALSGLAVVLAACAAPPSSGAAADATRQACLGRMYSARTRGAVNWTVYDNCLREHDGS